MLDLISIGDVTEDVFLQLTEAEVHCDEGVGKCQLCMWYADKIPVSRVDKLTGGNAGNNAIGGSRLGLKSALYAEVGQDDQGLLIKKIMKGNGVDLRYLKLVKGVETNYSVVLNLNAERTILIYHVPRKYHPPKFQKSEWIYYTSMGHGFEVVQKAMVKTIDKYKPKVGFNPGTHQLRKGAKALAPVLKRTEIIFLNKEETQQILKTKKSEPKYLCKSLRKLGPKIAVVTDGPNGSFAYDGKDCYFQDIFECPVIERTGCGDSYAVGFLAAIHYGNDIKEAMRWGTVNAASVIQQIGPQNGLIKLKELKAILKKNPRFKPRKI